MKGGEGMTEKEIAKVSIEEFLLLQSYMLATEKEAKAYKLMKRRYIALKAILNVLGVNVTELDEIKE